VGYRFRTELWLHQGDTGWHFVTLPHDHSDEIDALTLSTRRGFGSVRVSATIGATSWRTSIFPDTKAASYVLPVKQQVRSREGLTAGDHVEVQLELVDE
jgi:hypothetical protein